MRVSDIFSRGGDCGGGGRYGGDRGHRGDRGYDNGSRRYRSYDSGYSRGDDGRGGRRGDRDHEELLEVLGIGIL